MLSLEELRTILENTPKSYIKEEYGTKSIYFDGCTFEDEELLLTNLEINLPVIFNGCSFKTKDKIIFISGLIFNEAVTFEGCTLNESLHIDECTFHKSFNIKYSNAKRIHLSGGSTFKEINISGYEIDKIWVSGITFNKLNIGGHPINGKIKKLTIFTKEGETGDINISNQEIEQISLLGTNNENINFNNFKCNLISLTNFNNRGSLNFYGIKPIDTTNENRYFQIINSTLNKSNFYRVSFSKYKELIIIDSFISNSLFVSCDWSNNIRSIYGPGYNSYKKSLKEGRKTSKKELSGIKEAYRQLKISMSTHSDKIQEYKFYSQELTYHNKILSWDYPWKNQFWDKLILDWSRRFSDYGQSFIKPLYWLLFGYSILFLTVLIFNGFGTFQLSLAHASEMGFKEAFENYFVYINPFRGAVTTLSGYLIVLDMMMRIWCSYMIYNLIRATRRFIS